MVSHELRRKPMLLWMILFLCSSLAGCEAHETIWNEPRGVTVRPGVAITPWMDAQVLSRIEDAGATLDTDAAGSSMDAAVSDASAAQDGGNLDATTAADAADADGNDAGVPFEVDERCEFRVTLLSLGGRYAPKNIGAVWIEHDDGNWVKTLAVWAGVRLRYLTTYRAANPTGNKVDAVTSGTLPAFGDHVLGWNLADAMGSEVPDGAYRVHVEVTDRDSNGETFTIPFTKRAPPFDVAAADGPYFSHAMLRCR